MATACNSLSAISAWKAIVTDNAVYTSISKPLRLIYAPVYTATKEDVFIAHERWVSPILDTPDRAEDEESQWAEIQRETFSSERIDAVADYLLQSGQASE